MQDKKSYVVEPEDVVYTNRVWLQLKEIMVARLGLAHTKLESCSEMIECAKLQAEIKLLKALLQLPETGKLVTDEYQNKGEVNG